MKKYTLRTAALLTVILFLFAGQGSAQLDDNSGDDWYLQYETDIVRGKIIEVSKLETIEDDWFFTGRQLVTVEITSGRFRGHIEELENLLTGIPYRDLQLRTGDQVLLFLELDEGRLQSVNLYDVARDRYIYILLAAFIFSVILVGRVKGFKALLTLAFMAFVIFKWLLPLILQGYNPLLLTVLFASLITLVTLTIIGGLNAKTAAAIIGTIGGLLVAGIIAWGFGNAASLTGFSTEEAQMLQFAELPVDINIRGLLFAGIIIGALGAMLDIAMSIASSVAEIKIANPLLTAKGLFAAGFNVGKDVMGTMINTLILAYTGGALPLLLLFMAYDMSYMRIINMDLIATEIVRSLAGSFGLLVAVPLTAAAAALLMSRFESKKSS
jgi:uncharacterized membrane protein